MLAPMQVALGFGTSIKLGERCPAERALLGKPKGKHLREALRVENVHARECGQHFAAEGVQTDCALRVIVSRANGLQSQIIAPLHQLASAQIDTITVDV